MPPSVTLGVDFGTSHTVAVVRQPDGSVQPLLFDGSPLLSSAVYAEESGGLLVGRDADHSARLRPERFEPNPKRRVDDGTVLLGDSEFDVSRLFAAVLERVRIEAERVLGGPPSCTVVTHPAAWGPARRLVLVDACEHAGLGKVTLLPEPVAAARYFARRPGISMAGDAAMVVYDFGGGTFDVSVVAATATGFEVLAVDGSDTLGGVDIDHALVQHIGRQFGDDDRWARLLQPTEVSQRRHRRTFLDDVRATKERLSRGNRVDLLVPLLDVDTQVTREELEAVTEPLLAKAVRLTQAVMRTAAVPPDRIAGVFLVGGASRMPLAATTLHRGIGIAPTVIDQPELVVATGATIQADPVTPQPVASPVTPPVPISPAPLSPTYPPPTSYPSPVGSPVATMPPRVVAPSSARIPGLAALHWAQSSLFAVASIVTFVIILVDPPPAVFMAIASSFTVLAAVAAVVTAVAAIRLVREPDRLRVSVAVTQWVVVAVIGLAIAIFVFGQVPHFPVLRAAAFAPGAIAVVILGLVRLGRPPQPITRERALGELRGTLVIQLILVAVSLLIAGAWWVEYPTTGSAGDGLGNSSGFAGLATLALIMMSVAGAVHLSRLSMIDSIGTRRLRVWQAIWAGVGGLYSLQWFYSLNQRLMPGLASRDWRHGIGSMFNELGLWTLVISALAAILVLIQLNRLAKVTAR
ncbi:Hsp70 protein [Stackebrandtia endophytica]|uniref:Hsp70 protein n=1 Tax=Stackebrandtia endophytica TaxID=1496996 RepID=A0A543B3E0_9ACTN|nr:Hsp70 family protein [Stackebrandtia endophytica]TQL79357.1 Hsp70 protein [Stackebrandtia endophytica]